MGVQPVVNLLPGRLGKCGLHPAHDLVHDIMVDVLELVLRKTVRHRVNKPSLSFYLRWSGWRLATLLGKRAGFPFRSRWSAVGRNKKAARLVAGFG